MKQYAVVYKDIPLMPCSKRRAHSLVRCGRAKFDFDKTLGRYLRLLSEPSGYATQKLALGVDTGTMFSGFSVVGEDVSVNVEFEHTVKKNDKNYIKKKTFQKNMYRRAKRSRLRHREPRFSNRTGHKYTYTSNYYFQNLRNTIDLLCRYYPVSDIVIEDVRSIHTDAIKNSGFSPIEQIKMRLYNHCTNKATLWISQANPKTIRSFNWSHLRAEANGNIKDLDLKSEDKSEKSFYAHCLDSHSLACLVFGEHLPYSDTMLYIERRLPNIDKHRRNLSRIMAVRGTPERRHSKFRRLRTKITDDQGYHGPWEYALCETVSYTKAQRVTPYGSSIKISASHCENCKQGDNKYKTKHGYEYYTVQQIKAPEILNHVSHYTHYEIPTETWDRVIKFQVSARKEIL